VETNRTPTGLCVQGSTPSLKKYQLTGRLEYLRVNISSPSYYYIDKLGDIYYFMQDYTFNEVRMCSSIKYNIYIHEKSTFGIMVIVGINSAPMMTRSITVVTNNTKEQIATGKYLTYLPLKTRYSYSSPSYLIYGLGTEYEKKIGSNILGYISIYGLISKGKEKESAPANALERKYFTLNVNNQVRLEIGIKCVLR